MKELFDSFPRVSYTEVIGKTLVDTCAFLYVISHTEKLKKFSKLDNLAMTSFNAKELIHVSHRLSKIKHIVRKYLKDQDITIVDVPVSPGNYEKEKSFVNSIDPELLRLCPDASDAVLLATAVFTKSDVFTKDKHHVFTSALKNYTKEIEIKKELKDF